ncbi:MAG: hypothetical protein A2X67_09130 [Ignavibacteria bacterium GWA2_55_11]|nr:MAG: hypothetical protein A2X67_09130 [Ignavibacteria bacterium GWA2_55_11]
MILDILLAFWLIGACVIGFRDGIVRKAVSIVMTIVALVLGQVLMREAGDLLIESAGVDPTDAPLQGFLSVFFLIVMMQALVYRFATDAYKIGGLTDRFAGAALGVLHGIVFLSCFLFIMAMSGWPSRTFKKDSRIYKGIVNVAPQILDLVMNVGPESYQQLKDMSSPDAPAIDPRTGRPAIRRPAPGSDRQSRMLDSLRSQQRR